MPIAVVRSSSINAKITARERRAAERIAEADCLSLSEVQRLAIRELAKRRGFWPSAEAEERDAVDAAASESRRHTELVSES